MNDLEVKLEVREAKGSKLTIAVVPDGKAPHVEKIDIAIPKQREGLIKHLGKKYPALAEEYKADLERELDSMADEYTRQPVGTDPKGSEELDVSRIVRPHLFHVPEVSGLLVPVATIRDGRPVGSWQLLVQWASGKRECRELEEHLILPNGDRLWLHPIPAPPLPGTQSGWTARGRRHWLEGYTPQPEEVFKELADSFAHFLDFQLAEAAGHTAVLTLWTMLTYAYPAWPAVPYLWIGGPLGSGKSRVFEVLARLVYRPLASSNMTAACLFRTLHDQGGTLLLDEAERLKDRTPEAGEMRTILLAGHKTGSPARRLERVGDGFQAKAFDVYGPKAIAGISGLPPALASRCIRLMMFRAGPNSSKPCRHLDTDLSRWSRQRDDLHALALANGPAFLRLPQHMDLCGQMRGREMQVWQPILAEAHLIEEAGAEGLLKMVQNHAKVSIEQISEDTSPEVDEVLLRLLAESIETHPQGITPSELLQKAKDQEPSSFDRRSPRGVSTVLNRYGQRIHRVGGKSLRPL